MSQELKNRILKCWHDPAIQRLIAGRADELWNAGPERIRAELAALQRKNPQLYWKSAAVQEALALTHAAEQYIAQSAIDPTYEPELPAEEPKSEARIWAEWRSLGGGVSSGGRVGDHYDVGGEQEDGSRRDDGRPRFHERALPLSERVQILQPAAKVAADNNTKE